MRKNLILVSMLVAFAFILMGCPQQPKDEAETTSTLQSLIDNAEDGSTLDLSAKKFTVGSEISIKKAITITGGKKAYDLEDVKVTVKADGVKIENVKNVAELIADETVKSITLGGTINIVTVEAANSDFKILVASNDVKIQTAVIKTKHMELIAMDNGCIQINVKGLPAKGTASNFDTHELEVMENGEPSRIGLEIQNDMEKTEYTYYYPFTKKDNKYVIRLICAFKDVASGNNVSYEEIAQITAKADYKKFNDYFNIENFDKMTLSSEYNSEDDRFDFIFDATALDSYKDAFPAEKVNNVHGDFGFSEKVSLNYDLMSKEEFIQMIEQMDIPAEALQSIGFNSKKECIQCYLISQIASFLTK